MAVTVKNIIPAKIAEAALTTQYTASGCKTIIDKFTVVNIGTTNQSITIHLVPKDGSATGSNIVVDERFVAPGQTWDAREAVGHVLEDGGQIATIASTGVDLSIRATGREIV